MSKPTAHPPRLSSLRDSEDSFGVGRMFREAQELPDERPEDLPRLRWRLRTSQRLRATRPRLVLRVAVVVGLAFLMGGVVGAVVSPYWARKRAEKKRTEDAALVATSPRLATRSSASRKLRAEPAASAASEEPVADNLAAVPAAVAEPPVGDAVVVNQARSLSPPAKLRSAVRVALRAEAAPWAGARNAPTEETVQPAPSVTSLLAAEQMLLSRAVTSLRREHDARTALTFLAQHAERFPQGTFTSEAAELRIEALLALGQLDEALAILDRMTLTALPNHAEQRVVRGELRAGHQRWREAAQDFDELLEGHPLPASGNAKLRSLQERALWGRAAARSRLGDAQGARADLRLYLRFFPAGQFAGAAAALSSGAP